MTLDRAERWVLAASVLLAVGAYAQTAGYEFAYDDVHIIQNNQLLRSLGNWRDIIQSTWWQDALYRPVTMLWFALDWALGGGDPRPFHVVNVGIHAVVTGMVYLLARGGLGPLGAGAAALLFAVHPVHVEAVANVVGRAELLTTAFTMVAALAYRWDGNLAAGGTGGGRRAMASFGTLAAVGLGLASKETAFATPGVLLLVDWWEARRTGEPARARLARHWVLWVATVAISLEWLWIRASVVGGLAGDHPAPGLEGKSLAERALVMAPVVVQYLRLLFFPRRLSADYSPDFLPVAQGITPAGLAGFGLMIAAALLGFRAHRRAPPVTFGLAWIGGTLLILANLIVPTGTLLAERTLYLPSVGAVIVVGWLAAWLEASWRRLGVALTALVVGLGMVRTVTRETVWRDNGQLFPQLIREAPESFRAYWLAGALAYDAGDRARGEALIRRAIVVYSLHPGVWKDLASQLEQDGRWLEAAQHYRAVFTIDSTDLSHGLAAVRNYIRAGAVDSAAAVAARIGRGYPHDVRHYTATAEVENARGRFVAAMTWRRRVAWRLPDAWQAWYLTAQAAVAAGSCWEAQRSTARVRALQPDLPQLAELHQRLEELRCDP